MNYFARALLVVVFCAIPLSTFAQWPWEDLYYAEMAYDGDESLSLLTVPDGSGIPFTQAYLPYGGTTDATITLTMYDPSGVPIAGYPREDIWLQSDDGGMTSCLGGTSPDNDTGADGTTHWTTPLSAGGYSESLLQVIVAGQHVTNTAGFHMKTNSPDINGDLQVNLVDVGLFATDFFGVYNYRSDFVCNGNLDLADVGKMAVYIGASCP